MKIKYNVSKVDFLWFQFSNLLRDKPLAISLALAAMWIFHSSYTYSGVSERSAPYKIIYSCICSVGLILFTSVVGAFYIMLMVLLGKHKGVVCEHELEIAAEGLRESTEFNQSLHKWIGICKIIETRRLYLIYINEIGAHVIPKGDHATNVERKQFVEEIRGFLQK
jgi:hypothetical protein